MACTTNRSSSAMLHVMFDKEPDDVLDEFLDLPSEDIEDDDTSPEEVAEVKVTGVVFSGGENGKLVEERY